MTAAEIIAALRQLDPAGKAAVLVALVAELAQPCERTPVVTNAAAALVDAAALSQALNLPRSWLMSQARQGKIPSVRVGKYVRFKVAEVEAALRKI